MLWFYHDTNASQDNGIMALRIDCGGAAVDAYYCILEEIYREEEPFEVRNDSGAIGSLTKAVSHRLGVDTAGFIAMVESMVENGLLEWVDGGQNAITSARAEHTIDDYRKKAEAARRNGKKGGRKRWEKERSKTKGKPRGNPGVTQAIAKKEVEDISSTDVEDKEKVEKETEASQPKRGYGEFGNVLLADSELEKLKERFPSDWRDRIERLDSYVESKGRRYKSHYATILSWARKDAPGKGVVADDFSVYD